MSDSWNRLGYSAGHPDPPREFLVSVELYVSLAAGRALRKPPGQRKKNDKRESSRLPSGIAEDNKKVKEKSSWLTLARGTAGMGQWRPATCKLAEDENRCMLNIYVDESILYQTIHVHLLNHTDIRQADSSLFFRKDCIGIYSTAGKRWTTTVTSEPVYLQFANSDVCNTWLTLLRSYAIPEIYGRWFSPTEGGSYRMWRQVDLTVIQGRNLGNSKLVTEGHGNGAGGADSGSEPDPIDLDVSCEILLNDILCGRTTVKKGIGSPDWHEHFLFSDLPPFDTLNVLVMREKNFKPTVMGSVRIVLGNFRRGESVEGWFPVLQLGPLGSDIQLGDIRLKIRVDEEIILPHSAYAGLLETINSRNFLDWTSDFENKLGLKTVSTQLMFIAVAKNVILEQVFAQADREVDGTPSSHQTLFRGNTTFTKVMEQCMVLYGKAFLEASIGSILRKLCAEKVAIEVDPVRSGKNPKDVGRSVDQLIHWCEEFWKQISSVREECPNEMRRLFQHVRKLVEKRYNISPTTPEHIQGLPWQSVSAFCFLRFIVPAILHPHLFGLCPGLPSLSVQRSLTLIAKVIQSLANLNMSVHKEEFMRGVGDFLQKSRSAMVDYIRVVSTPTSDSYSSHGSSNSDRHERLNIVSSLRQRSSSMAVLDREAIPILPHLLDIQRHLALIASAVIRSSKDYLTRPNAGDPEDKLMKELCANCFEVEEHALHRVSQLAGNVSSDRRQSSGLSSNQIAEMSPAAQSAVVPILIPSRSFPQNVSISPRRPRRNERPSTAPSASDSDASRSRHLLEKSPPSAVDRSTPPSKTRRLIHSKSTSTDSIPSYSVTDSSSVLLSKMIEAGDISDDAGKRKKGLFRGILRR